ncbi:MAG: hypothetical protein Q8N26_01820 [Myxococcales bacterium]|nr:hypothetical protein [Myxococcales bacterium]
MCMAVTCPKCGKADWRGCGAHVEQVLGKVPREQRCKCREAPVKNQATSTPVVSPPMR